MKINKLITLVTLSFMMVTIAFSAGTPAGTVIRNRAVGDYKDVNGNEMETVFSEWVETIVSQIAGVDIGPDPSVTTFQTGGSAYVSKIVTNTGNDDDTFDLTISSLTWTGSSSYTVEIYSDADVIGVIDGSDDVITATPEMAADATYNIIVKITDDVTAGDGDVVTVIVTATSQFVDNGVVSDVTDIIATVHGVVITLTPTVDNPTPMPGDPVTWTICINNNGSADANNVVLKSQIPANTIYVDGSMTFIGITPISWDITNGLITVNIGELDAVACPNYCVYISYKVTVLPCAWNTEICINPFITYGTAGGPIYGQVCVNVGQQYAVLVQPDASTFADPGDVVVYGVTVTNTGNSSDIFNITYTSCTEWTWTWTIYGDTDEDGELDDNEDPLTDTNWDDIIDVGTTAMSEVVYLLAVATVPAGTADEDVCELTLTATSVSDPNKSDEGVFTVTVTAPELSLTKSVSPLGPQFPGQVLTYSVLITNYGSGEATDIIVTDDIPDETTYVYESMIIDGNDNITDSGTDNDGGTYSTGFVVFDIAQLVAGGSVSCSFDVTIE